ncbi:MAG: tetratricopeptide repeat protein [Anaerolineales bacterium]|nr:tetratricopeptide repeat protein [Anaerolineales bacterium]MDW8161596.1 tetratricopeptide repeat protein [Anaerolineales bacterium]
MELSCSSIVRRLKALLPSSSWPWILPALRLEPLIWESLCNFEQVFEIHDLGEIIGKPEDCSPAVLALKALKYPRSPQELRLFPLIPVEAAFRERAEAMEHTPLVSLQDAALKALNLRQKRLSTGSWDDWTATLQQTPSVALVCLFGMIPDQIEFLQALLPFPTEEESEAGYCRVFQVILSNPAPFAVQNELIAHLLNLLSSEEREMLQPVLARLPPALAANIPILRSLCCSSDSLHAKRSNQPEGKSGRVQSVAMPFSHSVKIFAQDEPEHITQKLSQSIRLTAQSQALLWAKLAILSEGHTAESEAPLHWQKALHLYPDSEPLRAMALLSCANSERESTPHAEAEIRTGFEPETSLLKFAIQVSPGCERFSHLSTPPASLKLLAQQALDEVQALAPSDPFLSDPEILEYLLALLCTHCLRRRLYSPARQAIQLLLRGRPDHPHSLLILALLLHSQGDHEQALNLFHLLEAIYPEDPHIAFLLAQSHQLNREWLEALPIWRKLIQTSPSPGIAYEFISCAHFSDQPGLALEVCRSALQTSPQDGILLSLLAELDPDLKPDYRLELHQRAIELTPSAPYVWLAHARSARKNRETQKAIEILKAAAQTLPDNPFIYSALGELYLETGQPSLALSHLSSAAEIAAGISPPTFSLSPYQWLTSTGLPLDFIATLNLRLNPDWGSDILAFDRWYGNLIARYGETLQRLGYTEAAHRAVEEALQEFPNHEGLAHQLARLKMADGNFGEAGRLLQEVVLARSSNPQAVVDFARCALVAENLATPQKVIELLQGLLAEHPDSFEGLLLLAQALEATDQPQALLKLYDRILRFPQAHEPSLKEELSFKMSQAAQKAGEYELALATLLECDLQKPRTQQQLAEIYCELGLFQEAAQAVQKVRSSANSELSTLKWCLDLLNRIAVLDSAHSEEHRRQIADVLEATLRLSPQQSGLNLLLAETLYQLGNHGRAKEILFQFVPQSGSSFAFQASIEELTRAGHYLELLNEPQAALSCYERSLALIPGASPEEKRKASEILRSIAEIHRKARRSLEWKNTLERAIERSPDNPSLFLDYLVAWLAIHLKSPLSALDPQLGLDILAHFERHSKQNPASKELSLAYGLFLRWIGRAQQAIEQLGELVTDLASAHAQAQPEGDSALLLAGMTELGRIYRSRGEAPLAEYWSQKTRRIFQVGFSPSDAVSVEAYCDWLEGSLSRGEEPLEALLHPYSAASVHPRLTALLSRVRMHQGNFQDAKKLFESALSEIERPLQSASLFHPAVEKLLSLSHYLETLYTLCDVAQSLGQWNLALELLEQVLRIEPEGVRAHRARVQLLVRRAEYQLVCQHVDVVHNVPGPEALGKRARAAFEASVQFLQATRPNTSRKAPPEDQEMEEWITRGEILFSKDNSQQVEERQIRPEILGTLLLTAANPQPLFAAVAAFPDRPILQFQAALTALSTHPEWALNSLEPLLEKLRAEAPLNLSQKDWILCSRHFLALVAAAYARALLQADPPSVEELETKWAFALEALNESLEFYPEEVNWHLLAAELALRCWPEPENFQKAIEHLEQALRWNANSLDLNLKLAQFYLALQKPEAALQVLDRATQLDPQGPQVHYWLAKAYQQLARLDLAAQHAQTALEHSPLDIDVLILRSEIALTMRDVPTALQVAQQALEQAGENPRVWALLARALHASGRTRDAMRILERRLPPRAEYLDLHLERIAMLEEWRGCEAALEAINALLQHLPSATPLLLRQAEMLKALGQSEAAIHAAQAALRQAHQGRSALADHACSHRLLGELFYRSGHLDQAVYHLSEALKLRPKDDAVYLMLGDVYVARGESEHALDAYQQCLQVNPQNSLAYFRSGVLYKELKDYPRAEQMLRQAARIEPDNLAIQRQLGAVIALNLLHAQRTREKHNP